MKILLACLMCEILVASECYAIDGGPIYPGQFTVTGTYAGVMVPVPVVIAPGVTARDNSLAVFTLNIRKGSNPTSNVGVLATGDVVVFRNGILYSGSITGSADVDTAHLNGIISATTGAYGVIGTFVNTRIKPNTSITSTATARIRGKASLDYTDSVGDPAGDSGGAILYRVNAFKQAESLT